MEQSAFPPVYIFLKSMHFAICIGLLSVYVAGTQHDYFYTENGFFLAEWEIEENVEQYYYADSFSDDDTRKWLKAQLFSVSKLRQSCQKLSSDKVPSTVRINDLPEDSNLNMFRIELNQNNCECHYTLCFDLSSALWYGGAELHTQKWPLSDISLPMQPFVTNDLVPSNQSFGNVIERFWLNSKGVGIFETSNQPMMVSYNESNSRTMCFAPTTKQQYGFIPPPLAFLVIKGHNIERTYFKFKELIGHPVGIPDLRMIKSPIWSTWAKYKVDIDENKVGQYADEIVKFNFSNSQLEIDDMFSSQYGEFDFSIDKFKDPSGMVQKLKAKGFRVTVWITPFANVGSPAFKEGMEKGVWLKDGRGEVPALVKWWQGVGGTLDVTNEKAVAWYTERLEKMKKAYGIDSFKFDAGEITYLPTCSQPEVPWEDPTTYTTKYVEVVSKLGPMIEVRCGYKTQAVPVFVRMGDKESRWGYDNGLKTLIPTMFTMGILGYPFILPDMIGGNGYGGDTEDRFTDIVLPGRELYIRWLELTAYLPAMQFSFVPWQYDEEVVKIAQKFVKIHENIVTPILVRAAKVATKTGMPLIRPLWMIAPEDTDALECDSEFLVGNELLVAPILDQGATERDIYLPKGVWEDKLKQDTIMGGKWLRNYEVGIDEIPTFDLLQ